MTEKTASPKWSSKIFGENRIKNNMADAFFILLDKCFVILVTFCLCTAVQPNDKQGKLAH